MLIEARVNFEIKVVDDYDLTGSILEDQVLSKTGFKFEVKVVDDHDLTGPILQD